MDDLISREEVLETYAELYDIFDDYKEIKKELHKVYDKINALPSAQPDVPDTNVGDMISRQAAIDELKKTVAVNKNPNHDARIWEEGMNCAITIIGALPSAQPEIIRCKDCKYHEHEQPGMVYCPATVGGWVDENWYCAGAERRTDD